MGTKVTLPAILAMALVTLVVYLEVSQAQRESQLEAKATAATMVARLFSAGAAAPLTFGDEKGVQEQAALLTTNDQLVYGAVWALDAADASHLGAKLGEVVRGRYEDNAPPAVVHAIAVHRTAHHVVVDAPVTDPTGKLVGVAEVVLSLERENAAIRTTTRRTLLFSLATALGLVGVLYLLTRSVIVVPLARLGAAATRLESGENVDAQLEVRSADEVGDLARGFAAMSRAIIAREQRISERNRDLRRVLDNVAEGFLTVGLDGAMSAERSGILETWFGVATDGMSFHDYVERVAPKVGASTRVGWSALEEDFLPLELVVDQLPSRLEHDGRHFTLEYRPLLEDEAVRDVLVVIRDVTQQIERERAEQSQRDMVAVFRRILADRAGFDAFLAEAGALVATIEASTSADATTMRAIHTLKGNMGVFGVESLATLCHALEERIAADGEPLTSDEQRQLDEAWKALLETCQRLGAGSRSTHIAIDAKEHEALLAALREGADRDALVAMVAAFRDEPAGARLSLVADQIQALARRMGKGEVNVHVQVTPPELRLPSSPWKSVWPVLAHVVRNTVDHGIELPATREARGKSGTPSVTLSLTLRDGGATLAVSDDGAGIDWDAIRTRAERLGLPHASAADLEEALFVDKVSSRDEASEVSGRGVGMGAVREAIEASGGKVRVESRRGEGTTLRIVFGRAAAPAESGTLPVGRVAAREEAA